MSIDLTRSEKNQMRGLSNRISSVDLDPSQVSLPSTSDLTRLIRQRQDRVPSSRALSRTISPQPRVCQNSLQHRVTKNGTGSRLRASAARTTLPQALLQDKPRSCRPSENQAGPEGLSTKRQNISSRRDNSDYIEEILSDDEGADVDDNAPFSCLPASLQTDADFEITRVINRKHSSQTTNFKELDQIKDVRYNCTIGKCVELKDGSFLRVKQIIEDESKCIWIIGPLYIRHEGFGDSKWPGRHDNVLRHNEVVQIVKIKNKETVDMVKRPLTQVMKNRHLIVTNQSFPACSSNNHEDSWKTIILDKAVGPIFCRWKQTHVLDSTGRIVEEAIERISFEDADAHEPNARIGPSSLRTIWRVRPTMLGGEYSYFRAQVTGTGHELVEDSKYVFADMFCGAGGASCGADQAGLYISLGVDLNRVAIETYNLNFANKGTKCLLMDVHDFINTTKAKDYKVDVLHMSPPCQPFSPAHTVGNEARDDVNQAAMFAVGDLLKLLKPRVVTLEETYGLFNRHKEWFNALIRMFLECGYSIRWTGARLEEYGLPQKRRRLLIIAAGPGETLPRFPAATHSETDRSLKRLATIHDAISNIVSDSTITHHDPVKAQYPPSNYKPPYDIHSQAKTITTSGGIGNHHPDGTRAFTVREFACLQCFPSTYQFAGSRVTDMKRQIGNAVPPFVIKKVFREIMKSLKITDNWERANRHL